MRLAKIFAFITVGCNSTLLADTPNFDDQVRESLLRNPEIILEVFALLEAQEAAQASAVDAELIARNAVALFPEGADQGRVLVEFVDYQCGYCRRAATEVEALLEADPSLHRHIIQFPILGDASVNAASVMEAIRLSQPHDVFLDAHERLMAAEPATLRLMGNFVASLGLDPAEIMQIAESEEVTAIIAGNHVLARSMQITGTPGFVTEMAVIRGFADAQTLAALFAE